MMTSTDSRDEGYKESVWRPLGHPAFNNEFLNNLEDIEWWDIHEGTNTSNEKH